MESTRHGEVPKAVRVGVTGHRSRPGMDPDAIRRALRELLAALGAEVEAAADPVDALEQSLGHATGTSPGPGPGRRILVSALAEGCDQIAAEVALELGWELHAPLPFPREEYGRDFADAPAAGDALRRLLARATSVLELDGPTGDAPGRPARAWAYVGVGRAVLEHTDLLVAVWDGQEAGGRGGTAEVVAEAVSAKVPVLWVPLDAPGDVRLRTGEAADDVPIEPAVLRDLVRRILHPFVSAGPRGAAAGGAAGGEREPFAARQRRDYHAFLHEDPARLAARGPRAWLRGSWGRFLRRFHAFSFREPDEVDLPDPPDVAAGGDVDGLRALARRHFDQASALANHYTAVYRSAFLWGYRLAALAVALALVALLVPHDGPVPHWIYVVTAAFLELLCLATVLLLVWRGDRHRWRDRGVSYRLLAEHFRQLRYLLALGVALPDTRPPPNAERWGHVGETWVHWHYRAVVRSLGLPRARFTPDYRTACRRMIVEEWVGPQVTYHRETSTRYERVLHAMHRRSLVAFALAVVGCLGHLALGLGGIGQSHAAGPIPLVDAVFTVLAAGAPALGAAIHGVQVQGEFRRLARRNEQMAEHLDAWRRRVLARDEPGGAFLQDTARAVAEDLVAEVNDWQVLYRSHPMPMP